MNPLLLKAAPYLVAALALGGMKWQYDRTQQAKGAARVIREQAARERDSLTVRLDSLGKARVAQVETLRVAVVRRVPVRDTVERWLRDTVPVPVEVVRELVRVDSQVIQACHVVLNTCEQEKLALRADIRATEKQRDANLLLVPSTVKSVTTHTGAALVGALLCFLFCPKPT